MTKGAFFHHFRDREDLGFAVLDWHMDRRRQTNTLELARYIVTVIEGAIMQARTLGDAELLPRQLAYLKKPLKKCLEP